ncbi:unnamed protein product [Didymodactylos carnosus]|uniref:Constitutive coactivator of peroxisome proliferator-activated receptor gamma n=1 Tax=Didymodactylos carnosus TaxID=1234261 RepID=A0A813TXI3_9BILA|nr:unnamed protein product [Didymodactylos carnosus]CAF0815558.1 unnamed protein product [Didymodactylos carnosus]CAF3510708.1 unnamed protein product [Didymodactylos carnosus]CAF3601615.1 unnamed protein product [Didymodactylos carnosus]
MVGCNYLLDFFSTNHPSCLKDVDVGDIIRQTRRLSTGSTSSADQTRLYHLVVDVETCLERLYGGYYPDWLCGGEWSHLYSYMVSLVKTCQDLRLSLIFVFDGTLYRWSQAQWYQEQCDGRKKINLIYKHFKLQKFGQPRRHLWMPPAYLSSCLRSIIREFNSSVYFQMYQTSTHHNDEFKQICLRTDNLLGIVSGDLDLLLTQPIKYFSSKHFKLSLRGKLTLAHVQLAQLQQKLDLTSVKQLYLLATLLGNHILSDDDLRHFHSDLLKDQNLTNSNLQQQETKQKIILKPGGRLSPSLTSSFDVQEENDVCKTTVPMTDGTISSEDVTIDENNSISKSSSELALNQQQQTSPNTQNPIVDQLIPKLLDYVRKLDFDNFDINAVIKHVFRHLVDDELKERKTRSLIESYNYYQNSSISTVSTVETNEINSSHQQKIQTATNAITSVSTPITIRKTSDDKTPPPTPSPPSSTVKGPMPSSSTTAEMIISDILSTDQFFTQYKTNWSSLSEVLRTAYDLHKRGLTTPWIWQCLYKREITLPVTLEPEICSLIPSAGEFYRPIRSFIYGLLFNYSSHKHVSRLAIREQVYNSSGGSYLTEVSCDQATPDQPTLEQLWFGQDPANDRLLRMKTLLACLKCSNSDISQIPHDYLLLLSVLRYMFTHSSHQIQIWEICAFLSQALLICEQQPKPLMNLQPLIAPATVSSMCGGSSSGDYDQIHIELYQARPVQLAQLFVRGIETAQFANDVCGAPLHPRYCTIWRYFNGKLFHQKYIQATYHCQTYDLMMILCDGNIQYAQMGLRFLDIILDRTSSHSLFSPLQQQSAPVQNRSSEKLQQQKFVKTSRSNHQPLPPSSSSQKKSPTTTVDSKDMNSTGTTSILPRQQHRPPNKFYQNQTQTNKQISTSINPTNNMNNVVLPVSRPSSYSNFSHGAPSTNKMNSSQQRSVWPNYSTPNSTTSTHQQQPLLQDQPPSALSQMVIGHWQNVDVPSIIQRQHSNTSQQSTNQSQQQQNTPNNIHQHQQHLNRYMSHPPPMSTVDEHQIAQAFAAVHFAQHHHQQTPVQPQHQALPLHPNAHHQYSFIQPQANNFHQPSYHQPIGPPHHHPVYHHQPAPPGYPPNAPTQHQRLLQPPTPAQQQQQQQQQPNSYRLSPIQLPPVQSQQSQNSLNSNIAAIAEQHLLRQQQAAAFTAALNQQQNTNMQNTTFNMQRRTNDQRAQTQYIPSNNSLSSSYVLPQQPSRIPLPQQNTNVTGDNTTLLTHTNQQYEIPMASLPHQRSSIGHVNSSPSTSSSFVQSITTPSQPQLLRAQAHPYEQQQS